MSERDIASRWRVATLLLLFSVFGLWTRAEPAAADDLVLAGDAALSRVPLPRGSSDADLLAIEKPILKLAYLDDGRLMAVRKGPGEEDPVILSEIEADGSIRDLGFVPLPSHGAAEVPLDLSVDSFGRLFLLSTVRLEDSLDYVTRIAQLDAGDASTVQSHGVAERADWIARAPDGFWTLTADGLERLDPNTGLVDMEHPIGVFASDAETDSAGVLWLYGEGVCSPPCYFYARLDPATGTLQNVSVPLNPEFLVVRDLTVRRTCAGSDTTLCLQGGRFQAEVSWRDFEGGEGPAHLTSARSSDSGVFWFFEAANWELMVKVLDACDFNGKFWVFAAGSTNVEFELRVTDLQMGETRSYDNPLGRIAETVTDTAAFDCQ